MSEMKLPEPKGFKILIAIPELNEKFENSDIVRPDNLKRREEVASIIGLVIKLGDQAYKDKDRFPNGAYCKEGDFVIMRSYSGTRFKIASEKR